MATSTATPTTRYQWFTTGDINGFFGLMVDNVTVLSFLAGILILGFQFPADIVYKVMAFRLARRTNNPAVTAMPLGLDTPSTIGMALTVLGPAFIAMKARGMVPQDAAMMTWYIGMATM